MLWGEVFVSMNSNMSESFLSFSGVVSSEDADHFVSDDLTCPICDSYKVLENSDRCFSCSVCGSDWRVIGIRTG